jgi:hypothetical protein
MPVGISSQAISSGALGVRLIFPLHILWWLQFLATEGVEAATSSNKLAP